MKEFLLTSKKFKGSLRFGYGTNGILEFFKNEAILTDEQLDFFEHNFPHRIENLVKVKGTTGEIKEVTDVSFDAFWNAYGYKVAKPRAEAQWNKLSRNDRIAAIAMIGKFKYQVQLKNIGLVYPERYLKDRRFEDEF